MKIKEWDQSKPVNIASSVSVYAAIYSHDNLEIVEYREAKKD